MKQKIIQLWREPRTRNIIIGLVLICLLLLCIVCFFIFQYVNGQKNQNASTDGSTSSATSTDSSDNSSSSDNMTSTDNEQSSSTSSTHSSIISSSSSSTPVSSSSSSSQPVSTNTHAIRFYGHGTGDIDRVKIGLSGNVNVSGDFTIEWWMRATTAENDSGPCNNAGDNWIRGNILFDRDIDGSGDYGDYGISIYGGKVAFGASTDAGSGGICSSATVADGNWHHVAVTRTNSGTMRIFVDGVKSAETNGPAGNISYLNGQSGSPNDPYLVIGAEKHDYDVSNYPSYSGWIDEVRISKTVRYTANFARPSGQFTSDTNSVALYHFNFDGNDSSGNGNHGNVKYGGGGTAGPAYDSVNKPF